MKQTRAKERRASPDYDGIWDAYEGRFRKKKITNICISVLIVFLGVSSFIYGWHIEPGITIFRFLTVDGTLFTTAAAAVFVIANLIEILAETEVTRKTVYYVRLSAAVAESVSVLSPATGESHSSMPVSVSAIHPVRLPSSTPRKRSRELS